MILTRWLVSEVLSHRSLVIFNIIISGCFTPPTGFDAYEIKLSWPQVLSFYLIFTEEILSNELETAGVIDRLKERIGGLKNFQLLIMRSNRKY